MVAEPGFGSIWSKLSVVNQDHFKAIETASHWTYIVCFPSRGIFIAMRYNVGQGGDLPGQGATSSTIIVTGQVFIHNCNIMAL